MKRSTAALIIAILFHLLIILLFVLLGYMMPEIKKSEPKKEEERIKVSLIEKPETAKQAPVENKVKHPEAAPPMPKGKQLERIVQKPFKKVPEEPKPVEPPPPVTKLPVEPKELPQPEPPAKKTEPLPPKKTEYIPPEKVEEAIQEKKAEEEDEHGKLYAFLSKKVISEKPSKKGTSKERTSRISEDIKEAYGSEFGKLTEGELKYILDNEEIMRRITQQVLNRVGAVNIPNDFRINSYNVVEFYLHPNGDISDLRIIKKSGFYLLDDTTKETIEYAYSKYPLPKQKTLIRYRVGYYLQGY